MTESYCLLPLRPRKDFSRVGPDFVVYSGYGRDRKVAQVNLKINFFESTYRAFEQIQYRQCCPYNRSHRKLQINNIGFFYRDNIRRERNLLTIK